MRASCRLRCAGSGEARIRVAGPAGSDPDFVLRQAGFPLELAESTVDGLEVRDAVPLEAGDYVLEVYEFLNTTSNPRGRTCLEVSIDAS